MMHERFRGFLPVVIDIETAGFNPRNNPILEIAAVMLDFDAAGQIVITESVHEHVIPEEGMVLDEKALAFNGIQPFHPFRMAVSEYEVFDSLFRSIRAALKAHQCSRSVLVAHNAAFDMSFIMQAAKRHQFKRNPFHAFTTFDTATLGGVFVGHTVLAKICGLCHIPFDNDKAHNALYDATKTAEFFCWLINRYHNLGGWPLATQLPNSSNSADC